MPRTLRYCRPKADPPESILDFLLKKFPYLDRGRWQAYLADGTLLINRSIVPETYILKQQDVIQFDPPRELEPQVDGTFAVKYIDEDVVVVEKSGNIPVSEGGRYCKATLVAFVAEELGATTGSTSSAPRTRELTSSKRAREDTSATPALRAETDPAEEGLDIQAGAAISEGAPSSSNLLLVVHRLDKETSGLVCFARTKPAATYLSSLFQNKGLERDSEEAPPPASTSLPASEVAPAVDGHLRKIYFAIVIGALKNSVDCRKRIGFASEGEAEAKTADGVQQGSSVDCGTPSRLSKLRMKWFPEDSPFGKAARSIITPLCDDGGRLTLVKVEIFTGRTHQIRLHCQSVGCPILGDKMYELGAEGSPGSNAAASDETYLRRARGEEATLLQGYGTPPQNYVVPRQMLHAGFLEFTHPPADHSEKRGAHRDLPKVQARSDPVDAFLKDCPFLEPWLNQEKIRALICKNCE